MTVKTETIQLVTTRRGSWRARWRNTLTAYVFLLPFIIFFLAFRIVPTLFGIGLSFTKWQLLEGTQSFVGFRNFVMLFDDSLFWLSFGNSIYFAVLTTVGVVLVSLASALGLRSIIHGQTIFRVVLYAPVILSISVIGIIWGRVLANNGLLNYYLEQFGVRSISFLGNASLVMPSLALTTIWWSFGFPMLIFLSGLYAIPDSLYEAARLDGAGSWSILTQITLPLLRPAMLLVTVTQFIGHMQVFGQPYILTQGGPGYASYPLILYLYQTAWRYYHMGYASAMAVALAIFLLIASLIQIRWLGERVEY
jgi:multiple sugar transport system permease protein